MSKPISETIGKPSSGRLPATIDQALQEMIALVPENKKEDALQKMTRIMSGSTMIQEMTLQARRRDETNNQPAAPVVAKNKPRAIGKSASRQKGK
ncbi:hypothetical protein CCP2SC5_280022 [Azospirillaceae bacterium]